MLLGTRGDAGNCLGGLGSEFLRPSRSNMEGPNDKSLNTVRPAKMGREVAVSVLGKVVAQTVVPHPSGVVVASMIHDC